MFKGVPALRSAYFSLKNISSTAKRRRKCILKIPSRFPCSWQVDRYQWCAIEAIQTGFSRRRYEESYGNVKETGYEIIILIKHRCSFLLFWMCVNWIMGWNLAEMWHVHLDYSTVAFIGTPIKNGKSGHNIICSIIRIVRWGLLFWCGFS